MRASRRAARSEAWPSRRCASARIGGPSGRPRQVEGAICTAGVWRRRFAFPATFQVRKYAVSPSATMCTGVDTARPSRRDVVSRMYFAPDTGAKYPAARRKSGLLVMRGLVMRGLLCPGRRHGAAPARPPVPGEQTFRNGRLHRLTLISLSDEVAPCPVTTPAARVPSRLTAGSRRSPRPSSRRTPCRWQSCRGNCRRSRATTVIAARECVVAFQSVWIDRSAALGEDVATPARVLDFGLRLADHCGLDSKARGFRWWPRR